MVESELMQDGSPEVIDRQRLIDGVVTQLVGRPKGCAGFKAPARDPQAEAVGVVVAPIAAL